jgi:hypothetical protein
LKGKYTYLFVLIAFLASVVLFPGCKQATGKKEVKIPRLDPKYSYKDKEPMGSYIAYHYTHSLFKYGVTDVVNKSFSDLGYQLISNQSLYIIIAKSVFISTKDLESMMSFVSRGNTLFISAEYIDSKLIDTLGADITFSLASIFPVSEYKLPKKDTWVSLAHDPVTNKKKYGFFFVPFEGHFMYYDTTATQVLGYDEGGRANFISVDHGEGKFVLHTAPAAFSNYFLMGQGNKEYLEKSISYFNEETSNVYWDNYYRLLRNSDGDFSIFNFFSKHPPLFFALLLLLLLLLLFLAFGGKRRQRFVPEKIPPANTTVTYTETIGRLYLNKKDNRNIALKMFTYFLEQVRTNYYLNTQTLNNDFASALSRKSGVPEEKVLHLLKLMDEADRSDNISDIHLLQLHNLMQEYFKK